MKTVEEIPLLPGPTVSLPYISGDPAEACARSALVDPLLAFMKSALVSSLLLASATAFVPPSAGPVQSAASTFTRSSRHAAAAKAPAAGLSMRYSIFLKPVLMQ
jgi:hypothetical protein